MLNQTQRDIVADALAEYAEGVEEVLRDDDWPNPRDSYPVVEDYLADSDRIRAGETPLHAHTREVLEDETGPMALTDDPAAFAELVKTLYS